MAAFTQLTPGEVFARDFRVLRPLAEGGMGAVYRVEQVSTGRERALKIMHPQFARDAATRERFTLEARVGSRIHSEHVVEVVSAGVDDGSGMPWLAMELLEGGELSQVVHAHGALTPTETLEIFRQLAHGLGEAHRAGLVHRDIKPENLFLATSNRAGSEALVKILDFGVAKLVQEGQGSDTGTRAVGTPRWMAPEQSETGGTIVPATDVWPLGLLAFYLLTGRAYWRSASSSNTSLTILMREMLIEPIEPPSRRARELGVALPLPPEFDAWFDKCVVREVDHRFAHATAAFEALEPVLRNLGAQAGPGALSRLAAVLRSLAPVPATHTGPTPTPNPGAEHDSGDGATIYPAGGSFPPVPASLPPPVPTLLPQPVSAPAPAGRPLGLIVGLVGAVVVAFAIAARTLATTAAALAVTPPPSAPLSAVAPAVPPPAPVPASFPAEVPFTIESIPAGAEVFADDTRVGITPFETSLNNPAALERQRIFTLKAPGFQPYIVHQGRSREAVHVVATLTPEPSVRMNPARRADRSPEPRVSRPAKAAVETPTPDPVPAQPQIRLNR